MPDFGRNGNNCHRRRRAESRNSGKDGNRSHVALDMRTSNSGRNGNSSPLSRARGRDGAQRRGGGYSPPASCPRPPSATMRSSRRTRKSSSLSRMITAARTMRNRKTGENGHGFSALLRPSATSAVDRTPSCSGHARPFFMQVRPKRPTTVAPTSAAIPTTRTMVSCLHHRQAAQQIIVKLCPLSHLSSHFAASKRPRIQLWRPPERGAKQNSGGNGHAAVRSFRAVMSVSEERGHV